MLHRRTTHPCNCNRPQQRWCGRSSGSGAQQSWRGLCSRAARPEPSQAQQCGCSSLVARPTRQAWCGRSSRVAEPTRQSWCGCSSQAAKPTTTSRAGRPGPVTEPSESSAGGPGQPAKPTAPSDAGRPDPQHHDAARRYAWHGFAGSDPTRAGDSGDCPSRCGGWSDIAGPTAFLSTCGADRNLAPGEGLIKA